MKQIIVVFHFKQSFKEMTSFRTINVIRPAFAIINVYLLACHRARAFVCCSCFNYNHKKVHYSMMSLFVIEVHMRS